MSDSRTPPIEPVTSTASVLPVRAEQPPTRHAEAKPEPATATGGNLRAAYSEFLVDPDTRDVVVRIRDAATDEVLSELPNKDVQAMNKHMHDYVAAMTRRRTALNGGSGI